LRAIAALTVVGVHFAGKSGLSERHGYGAFQRLDVGVAIFFVISGFLLYRPFAVAHFDDAPPPRYGAFMKRRVLRIFPAYWVVLTILVLTGQVNQVSGWGIPAFYGLVHVYFPAYALGGLGQSWTLCTEMTFYLLLPAYAWLVGRRRRERTGQLRVELLGLLVLYVSAFLFVTASGEAGFFESYPIGLWLPAKVDLFALGMLLAVVDASRAGRPIRLSAGAVGRRVAAASWGLAGLAFWVVAARVDVPPTPTVAAVNERELFYGMIAFFLVLPAVIGATEGGVVRRFLRSRPMQLMGLISYGIYLWHLTAIHIVLRAAGAHTGFLVVTWAHRPSYVPLFLQSLLLTLGLAALSYVVIERPFLRLKSRTLWPRRARWPRGTGSAPEPALSEPGADAALWSGDGPALAVPIPAPHPADGTEPGERARPLGRGP
jgi:peptidoglycan/LPS O-acetylase OafA/YrhL